MTVICAKALTTLNMKLTGQYLIGKHYEVKRLKTYNFLCDTNVVNNVCFYYTD